ncbi:hypothetical protein JP0169_04610 [Helicobacter pylori]
MKLYKRVLKLHQFRNLGKKSPTGLLLNSSFEKHGELVILVGENNVGKSNILEALKAFNDTDIKLCNENDYFKVHEFEDAVLSLEEETSRNKIHDVPVLFEADRFVSQFRNRTIQIQ